MLQSLAQSFIVSFAFLIFKADNIVDIGIPFFTVNSGLCCITYYLVNMWKIPKILKLIEGFENFIEKSEFILMCDDSDNQIKRFKFKSMKFSN